MLILTQSQASKIKRMCVNSLADYVKRNHIKTLVLGISGGLDSAVMASLALRTIAKLNRTGYECSYIFDFIDIESNPNDLKKARELAKKLRFSLGEYQYTSWYQCNPIRQSAHLTLPKIKVANGNLKCHLRMSHLYDRAQLYGGIVLDTDDLSELLMGFWTKHGDVGDVKVIQQLTKQEVRDLGEYLGVPENILRSAPGDGLGVTANNAATDQLGMDYLKIDYAMSRLVRQGFNYNYDHNILQNPKYIALIDLIAKEISESSEKVKYIVTQSLRTAHKRISGNDSIDLIPNRSMFGLPNLGDREFNEVYLKAIQSV